TVTFRSSQDLRLIIPIPYEAPDTSVKRLYPASVDTVSTDSRPRAISSTSFNTRSVRSTVAPGGVVTLTYTIPWSSVGIKPDGNTLLTPQVAIKKKISMPTVIILRPAIRVNKLR